MSQNSVSEDQPTLKLSYNHSQQNRFSRPKRRLGPLKDLFRSQGLRRQTLFPHRYVVPPSVCPLTPSQSKTQTRTTDLSCVPGRHCVLRYKRSTLPSDNIDLEKHKRRRRGSTLTRVPSCVPVTTSLGGKDTVNVPRTTLYLDRP